LVPCAFGEMWRAGDWVVCHPGAWYEVEGDDISLGTIQPNCRASIMSRSLFLLESAKSDTLIKH
jgi:hypothetical protein